MSIKTVIILLLFSSPILMGLDDLPSNFPRCKRTDPNLEQCLLAATEQVRPYMVEGIPNFLPSIMNFTVSEVVMQSGNSAINYRASLNNITLIGLENYKFTRYHFNIANLSFYIEVELPHLFLHGHYNLDGKLLFAPIKGSGGIFVNTSDSSCSIFHTVKILNKNGVDYLEAGQTIPKMKIGKIVDYDIRGLFQNNKELEKVTKIVIHNNLNVIIEEITPAIEDVLGTIFDEVIFKSVTKIPYDKLYPQ